MSAPSPLPVRRRQLKQEAEGNARLLRSLPPSERGEVMPALLRSTFTFYWVNCHLTPLRKPLQSSPECGLENPLSLHFSPSHIFPHSHRIFMSSGLMELLRNFQKAKWNFSFSLSPPLSHLGLPFSCLSELSYSFFTSQSKSHFLWEAAPFLPNLRAGPHEPPWCSVSPLLWQAHICSRITFSLSASSPAPWGWVCISFTIDPSASGSHRSGNQ